MIQFADQIHSVDCSPFTHLQGYIRLCERTKTHVQARLLPRMTKPQAQHTSSLAISNDNSSLCTRHCGLPIHVSFVLSGLDRVSEKSCAGHLTLRHNPSSSAARGFHFEAFYHIHLKYAFTMPSILTEEDKQTVKRTVPKASNKIQAVAVAKLYIAYPDRSRWTYSGLQGAAVLADDLVGHTFWVKLVDVSPANRGVIWDQEIYENWAWNQDRTFFHTFELDDGRGGSCLAGLSFADEKEAKQFRKKMEEREKNASKGTRTKAFAVGGGQQQQQQAPQQKSHGLFGGLFSRGRGDSNPQQPAQSIIPPRGVEIHTPSAAAPAVPVVAGTADIDLNDPAVKAVLADLLEMGITEDQIHEHSAFIKSYLEQNKATAAAQAEKQERASRAPPPPPPQVANLSPQNTGSSKGVRGPPPAPPPSRRTATGAGQRPASPPPSPPREPSPPRPRFRVPPPLATAGALVNNAASLPNRQRAASQSNAAPAPPPRVPAKVPIDDESSPQPSPGRFAVPPPFEGKRISSNPGPPPPPRGGGVPPHPPPRDSGPPPPPPRTPQTPSFADSGPPAPPPLPPTTSRPVPPAPAGVNGNGPPAPPPLPPTSNVAPPPPPPPMPTSQPGPPPPPPMPPRSAATLTTDTGIGDDTAAAAQSNVAPPPGVGGLLADIRGGARLKKVSEQEKRDRSAAAVPGSEPAAGSTASGGGDAAAAGGLAGALASALAVRKSKVSHSGKYCSSFFCSDIMTFC